MDILHLVDRLEEILNRARSVPFTRNVIVDEESILGIIDQMRVAIPEEVRKSQQIVTQKERILAQAQEEFNRRLALAREKSDQLVEGDAIVKSAQDRADQVINNAHIEKEKIMRDADDYVIETLTRLEMELDRNLSQVRNGIRALQSDNQIPNSPE